MTGPTRHCLHRPHFGAFMVLVMTLLFLPSCASGPNAPDNLSLTKEQRLIREQTNSWQQTAATGALAGGALGGAIGAAFGGEYALIGAGVGAVVGLVAGVLVADRNLAFENRELSAKKRMIAAHELMLNLHSTALASERVSKNNRRILLELDMHYQAGNISAQQYRAKTDLMRADSALIRRAARETAEARQRLIETGRHFPDLLQGESSIGNTQERLENAADALESALARIPSG